MSDLDNYEINALRRDAEAGEYDYAPEREQDDETTTIRFLISAGRYGTATFPTGAEAYDFMHTAITAKLAICLSTVTGPGADAYSVCASASYKKIVAARIRLAQIIADSAE